MKKVLLASLFCFAGSLVGAESLSEVDLTVSQGVQIETDKDFGPIDLTFEGKSSLLLKLDFEQLLYFGLNPKLEWDFARDPQFELGYYEAYVRVREIGLALGVSDRPHLRYPSFILNLGPTNLDQLGLLKRFHGELSFAYEFFESQINVYEKDIVEYLGLSIEGLEFGLNSSQGSNTSLSATGLVSLGDFGLLYTEHHFIESNLTPQVGPPRANADGFQYKGLLGLQITLADISQAIYVEYAYNSMGYESPLWTKTSPYLFGIRVQNQDTSLLSYSLTTMFDTFEHGIIIANLGLKIVPQLSLSLDASLDLGSKTLELGLWLNGFFKAEENL